MKLKYKSYLHFDKKMSVKSAKNYLKSINGHQYLPFITFRVPKNTWDSFHNKLNEERTLSVCSHKDNYVYQYFNNFISKKYENYVKNY